jgi:biotin transporter BioY
VGGFITLFLLGAGLAGVALGNFHTGGFALLFGIVCLVAGTRDLFHRRHGFGRIIN